jgi:uncharacterized RDD family membrane protein YckC
MNPPTKVIGRRIGAFLIDWLAVQIVYAALFFAMASTEEENLRKLVSGEIDPNTTTYGNVTIGDHKYSIVGGDFVIYVLITIALGWLYYALLQGTKGWTLGKLATGIRTVREDNGQVAGVGKATVRWLLWIVDAAPYLIPYVVGLVTALATKKNQRVGDLVAKTLVVRKDAVGQPIPVLEPVYAGAGAYGTPPPVQQPQQADWYPDPQGQARLRYWDGQRWTDHTSA